VATSIAVAVYVLTSAVASWAIWLNVAKMPRRKDLRVFMVSSLVLLVLMVTVFAVSLPTIQYMFGK
jgi:polyferredoxin